MSPWVRALALQARRPEFKAPASHFLKDMAACAWTPGTWGQGQKANSQRLQVASLTQTVSFCFSEEPCLRNETESKRERHQCPLYPACPCTSMCTHTHNACARTGVHSKEVQTSGRSIQTCYIVKISLTWGIANRMPEENRGIVNFCSPVFWRWFKNMTLGVERKRKSHNHVSRKEMKFFAYFTQIFNCYIMLKDNASNSYKFFKH